jgi:putative membrane protein insertion efficiency factor
MIFRVLGPAVLVLLTVVPEARAASWDPWSPALAKSGIPPAEPRIGIRINPARLAGNLAIRAYQLLASPLLPGRCAFYPSCSGYTLAAISSRGLVNGTILGAERVMRCHGFAILGGYRFRPEDGLLEDSLAIKPTPLPWLSSFGL